MLVRYACISFLRLCLASALALSSLLVFAADETPTPPAPGGPEAPEQLEFEVDRFDDVITATSCTLAPFDCSLRDAVIAANNSPGTDTITLPAGTYTLSIAGAGEDAAATGDLDILGAVFITGAGAGTTIIDGNGSATNDRVFDVLLGAVVTLSKVTVRNGGGGLGGIFNRSTSTLLLTNSAVSSNGGAGILNSNATLTVTNSVISSNTGGGLSNDSSGTATLNNVTISGNSGAGNGAGLFSNSGTVRLNNVTLTNNTATLSGGGIAQTGGVITITNTLMAANSTSGGSSPDCSGTISSGGYNLVGNESGCDFGEVPGQDLVGTSGLPINPLLSALADNGGPTLTHALLPNSPAIDRGSPNGAGSPNACETTDQRSTDRPQGERCDIGAYEMAGVRFASAAYTVSETVGTAVVTVTLDSTSALTATVNYAPTGGTAQSGVDYLNATGVITFSPNTTTTTFSVSIVDDLLFELDETLTLTLSSPSGAVLNAPHITTLTILNDDAKPTIQFAASAVSVSESALSASLTVSLSAASGLTSTIGYATSDGTASAGEDYTAASGTLSIAPGVTTGTITVTVINESAFEFDETFQVLLSGPGAYVDLGAPSAATVTITNDDPAPQVRFSSSAYTASESLGQATITVTLSTLSQVTATVAYTASGGTATPGADYSVTSGTLTFSPNQTSRTFLVTLINDTLFELNETVLLTLTSPTSATLGTPATATLTLLSDDSMPTVQLSAASYSVSEGAAQAVITATLSAASGLTTTVTYGLTPGTASAGSDYGSASGPVTFSPGETLKTFSVTVIDDPTPEPDETLTVSLSAPVNATLGAPASAVLTLLNDDPWLAVLPMTVKNYVSYYEGPCEQEDNDTSAQANGPLRPGQAYCAQSDDLKDYFSVYLSQPGMIIVDVVMDSAQAQGIQLQLFYGAAISTNLVAFDPSPPVMRVQHNGLPGWYYIYIAKAAYPTVSYTVTATYP